MGREFRSVPVRPKRDVRRRMEVERVMRERREGVVVVRRSEEEVTGRRG
jgi:hypothetical protein